MAATVVTGVAVGVGVAMARAMEERRDRGRARPGLRRGETPTEGLLRMAREQVGVAIVALAQLEQGEIGTGVHEARKAIKRLRTLLRLLEGEVGEKRCKREQARLRRAAKCLSGARDAEVLLGTLEEICRGRRPLARRKGVRRMRKLLIRERDHARERLNRGSRVESALSELRAVEREIVAWQAPSESGSRSAQRSLRGIYSKGRRRARKARKATRRRTRAMHEWRKRVKDLRYAAEALGASDDGAASALRSPRQRRRMERLASIATRADTLGEALGEEHDLAVLQVWVREHGKKAGAGPGSRRALSKAIKRRRKRLRRRVLREGAKLYELEAGAFVRRLSR